MDKLGAVTVREWQYDKQLSVSECVISRLQIGYCVDRFSAWCFFFSNCNYSPDDIYCHLLLQISYAKQRTRQGLLKFLYFFQRQPECVCRI